MMAESLLLLSDAALAEPLSVALRRHHPALAIVCVQNREQLDNAMETAGRFDRLVAFCTETIVPAAILQQIGGPAYNIHPASPQYPGSHPASFAIYEGATRFGATAHEMVEKVDAGPIVAVDWFDVPPGVDFLALEDKAGETAAHLFWRLAEPLGRCRVPLPRTDDRWGPRKTTRKDFRAMGEIDPAIDPAEFALRVRAFGARDPDVMQIRVHGRRFVMVAEPSTPAAQPT